MLAVALLSRLCLLGCEPNGDSLRYVWEGKVVLTGANPYAQAPDAEALAWLRDPSWHGQINHPSWTAIYGPGALLGFAAIAWGGERAAQLGLDGAAWIPAHRAAPRLAVTLLLLKLALIAGELLALALLWRLLRERRQREAWLIAAAWHPLLLWSGAAEAHLESLMLAPMMLLLLALRREGRAAALIAGAALAALLLQKATALLLLPLLATPRWRPLALASALALTAAGYALFAEAGWGLADSVWRFGEAMRFNDLPSLLLGNAQPRLLRGLAVGALALLALALIGRRTDAPTAALWLSGAFLLVSPTVHAWYAAPLVLLCALAGGSGWWVLTLTLLAAGETAAIERASGAWSEPAWTRPVVYYPLLGTALLCARTWWRAGVRPRPIEET